MKTSVAKLESFLQKEYIDNPEMDSANMNIAISDLLADLLHVSDKYGVNIIHRLRAALGPYREELSN